MSAIRNHTISYLEFTTTNIEAAKVFYGSVFGWQFKDWGPDYIDCTAEQAGVAVGFAKGDPLPGKSAPLAVFYASDLAATEAAIVANGGSIVVPTFEFPGGRRFHFADGLGNTLAVWSE